MVAYRHLGSSGLKITEITYGNWLTHGSQVESDTAIECVHTALDLGITSFDTADVYANTAAEEVLGRALAGQRREGLEIFTKVYWPIGPEGPNDVGLSRKHIMEGINGSLRRLGVDYVDLYQAHRYDYETPLEETMQAFADVVRAGKALYIGVSEWTAEQIRAGQELAGQMGLRLVSNQPQYSALWRVIEEKVVPASQELGLGQIVWSPMAEGVLSGKYLPGAEPPAGSRATDDKGGKRMIARWMRDEVLTAVQRLRPVAERAGLSMPQLAIAWVLQNPNVSAAIVGASRPEQLVENVKASGVVLEQDVLAARAAAVSAQTVMVPTGPQPSPIAVVPAGPASAVGPAGATGYGFLPSQGAAQAPAQAPGSINHPVSAPSGLPVLSAPQQAEQSSAVAAADAVPADAVGAHRAAAVVASTASTARTVHTAIPDGPGPAVDPAAETMTVTTAPSAATAIPAATPWPSAAQSLHDSGRLPRARGA